MKRCRISRVENNNTSAFFWGTHVSIWPWFAAGAEACTRLSAARNLPPASRGSLDPSLSPSWSSNAPAELALRDAAASLLRVLARGIPASAPARHRQLRPALELDHGTRWASFLSNYPPARPSSTTSLAARGEGQVCVKERPLSNQKNKAGRCCERKKKVHPYIGQ